MTTPPKTSLPQRKPLRLPTFDYAQTGACFITACSYRRAPLFGSIEDGKVTLTDIGTIVEEEILRTPKLRPAVTLDLYIVMPNHAHFILFLKRSEEANQDQDDLIPTPFESPSETIGAIVRGIKGASVSRARKVLNKPDLRLWQREYHDHVIRDDEDLTRIRNYIQNNVLQWELDRYYLETGALP